MTGGSSTGLRSRFQSHRERLRERFFQDLDPRPVLRGLSAQMDRLVRRLSRQEELPEEILVLATGGYGRRELFPCSDVDLFFLVGEEKTPAAEEGIRRILHRLWDLGLQLGHQVWRSDHLIELGVEDLELVLSLLEARVLWGNPRLQAELLEEFLPRFLSRRRQELVRRLVELTRNRHRDFQDTIYQLEPDLKRTPGGLRDFQVARWLARLGHSPLYLPYRRRQVQEAYRFLLRLRLLLHYLCRRNQNQLTHRLQEEVSLRCGYGGTDPRSAVESLMKEFFLNARVVHAFCEANLRAASGEDGRRQMPPLERIQSIRQVLRRFRESREKGRPFSQQARRQLVRELPRLSSRLSFPTLREELRRLLKPQPGLYRILSEMYELGWLELLFPEFGGIRGRVIRDFYHKYTVDEHTLLAIRNVEELTGAEADGRFRTLLEEAPQPELLVLALLLHDVGKSREGKHTARSARMAGKALRRFRFPKEEVDQVVFLVRHHLAMSQVILRRDLEDDQVVETFADLVGDPQRLRLLCLLTYADIKAVGPGTLNAWKKDLLWQLYVQAYRKLTVGYGIKRIAEEQVGERILRGLPPDLNRREFESFLQGFPNRYLKSVPAAEIYQHFRLARRLEGGEPVQIRLQERATHHELCVVTSDRYFLFAKIVGVLSYFGMNILRGYGFSNRRNTVLDFFQFTDLERVFELNPEEKKRLEEVLSQAIQGKLDVEELLRGRTRSFLHRSPAPSFPPTFSFEDDASGTYSILEIIAPDSVGLLYRIGREIARLRLNIDLVLISTEGDRAVDVFYLSREGRHLTEGEKEKLVEALELSLGEGSA